MGCQTQQVESGDMSSSRPLPSQHQPVDVSMMTWPTVGGSIAGRITADGVFESMAEWINMDVYERDGILVLKGENDELSSSS